MKRVASRQQVIETAKLDAKKRIESADGRKKNPIDCALLAAHYARTHD